MAMRKMGNQLTRRGGVVVLNADALSVPPWQPLDGGPVRGTSGAGCERWTCTSEAGNRSTSQYEGPGESLPWRQRAVQPRHD